MQQHPIPPDRFFFVACCFEVGLVPLACLFGWLADVDPLANMVFSEAVLGHGLLATVPMVLLLVCLQQIHYRPLQEIRTLLLDTLGPRLAHRHWTDLLILACAAGWGEEALFRGFLQPWLENSWGMDGGLLASNLVFALVHAITPVYAALAFLIGLYLGWVLDYGGERNLWVPTIVHAVYDFVAFVVILRSYRQRLSRSPE